MDLDGACSSLRLLVHCACPSHISNFVFRVLLSLLLRASGGHSEHVEVEELTSSYGRLQF